MEYTILGRSGLKVSVAGLGCGGPSRLGLREGKTEKEAVALVRQSLDLGVNLLDTAEAYGTEEIVGKAIKDLPRDRIVISTKKTPPPPDHPDPGTEIRKGLEQNLRRLGTDYIDIYHLHGVEPEDYSDAAEKLAPVFVELREKGKIRLVGITEAFVQDPGHQMLQRALGDDCWDVVMVGFSILNQSASRSVLPVAMAKKIGVLVMFALRRALSQPSRLREVVTELKEKGLVEPGACDGHDPLGFVIRVGRALTIPDAAYRYCRHEPGVHVVLTGTGKPEHLKANLESLSRPPLPEATVKRLREIFGKVDSVTGN